MKAVHLRTEYMKNPVGIDIAVPRLFWHCDGGKRQTAYQIIAWCDGLQVWNTGKVQSSRMTHIPYGGEALQSRQKIQWSVKLWDENDEEGQISTASFEMGLLEESDWKATWITGDYKVDRKKRYPVDCFRKKVLAENIRSARLYVTVLRTVGGSGRADRPVPALCGKQSGLFCAGWTPVARSIPEGIF